MKLYYIPGVCSLAPHIIAREAGIALQLEKVDTHAGRTETGRDYREITAKNYVPALEIAEGQVLTEGPAIQQFLADLNPGAGLAPANGTLARYQLQSTLGYINSELHKPYGPLFNQATPESVRVERKAYLQKRYAIIEDQLVNGPFLFGEQFSIADAYLFTVTSWARGAGVDLSAFPRLRAFQARVAARPAVQEAMAAEGLIKAAKAA